MSIAWMYACGTEYGKERLFSPNGLSWRGSVGILWPVLPGVEIDSGDGTINLR